MALSPFRLPRLRTDVRLIDEQGRATIDLQRWWQEVVEKIEAQELNQDQLIADIQTLQAQQALTLAMVQQAITDIQIAQATANANGGAGASGADTDSNITVSSTVTWAPGPSVSLTGVVANNLTIPGSGPQQDSDVTLFISNVTQIEMLGEYRLVEVIGGVDGATFGPWNFSVNYPEPPPSTGTYPGAVINTDSATVAAFSTALATTGAIEYRLDFRRISGPTVQNLRGYLFVRRS